MPDGVSGAPLVLVTTDAVGGVWRYSIELARGLAARGVRVALAVMGPEADAGQAAEAEGVPGLRLVRTGLPLDWTAPDAASLGAAAERLAALAGLLGARSVHLHAPGLVGGALWPAPVVAVCHSCLGTWWRAMREGPPPEGFAWRIAATAEGLRRADRVIAPSAAQAEAMREVYGAVGVEVVHNGLAVGAEPVGRGQGVLAAGRLWDEAKGMVDVDAAGVKVRAAGPVAGPNGERASFENMELLGNLDAAGMARAYGEASVFVSMARYEPFGLAVLEAARAGLRLVLRDIPTFRELWGGAARFVAGPVALRDAVEEALAGEGDGGARERARRYTSEACVAATWRLHRELVA